jgi:fibrillarin-like rRNA methylase
LLISLLFVVVVGYFSSRLPINMKVRIITTTTTAKKYFFLEIVNWIESNLKILKYCKLKPGDCRHMVYLLLLLFVVVVVVIKVQNIE